MQIIENTYYGTTQNPSEGDYSQIDDGKLKAKLNDPIF